MNRTYAINKTETGWELIVCKDGEEFARSVAGGTAEDYFYLYGQLIGLVLSMEDPKTGQHATPGVLLQGP